MYTRAPINLSTITGLRYPTIPRLRGHFLLGRLGALFQENGMLDTIIEAGHLAKDHSSGMCYFWIGTQLALLVTKIDDIHELMVKYPQHLSRNLPLLEIFAGPSIFTDSYDLWRQKRCAYNHATHAAAVKRMEPGMKQVLQYYLAQLHNKKGEAIQLRTLLTNLVVDMVSMNLMACPHSALDARNTEINQLSALANHLATVMENVFEFRNVFKYLLPEIIRNPLFKHEVTNFEAFKMEKKQEFCEIFLNPNKEHILASENLLNNIWHINSQNHGDGLTNDAIYSDSLFLLSAGVATTVATLEFIIKLLAAHPEKAKQLHTELNYFMKDEDITLDAINEIPYLDMVIKEVLRLYPPVPLFIPRELKAPIEINGIPLFKGDIPTISPYLVHRSEQFWEQPLAFFPERFAKENKIIKEAYMPFSIGPRFCAGQKFALQEIKLILAVFYYAYQIDVENNSLDVTLRQGGLAPKVPPIVHFRSKYSSINHATK